MCTYLMPLCDDAPLPETVRDIVVTWSTKSNTTYSLCEYGIRTLNQSAQSPNGPTNFTDGGKLQYNQYIHRVTLANLKSNATYFYHCGSSLGWSSLYWFRTPPKHKNWSPTLAIYGDMGVVNSVTLATLQRESQLGMYDAILHVGDFAYDFHHNNGQLGDQFMQQIEPIAAYVPYMTCVGNHEETYNYSHYRNRFSMPGGTENMYYSFDMGPVHFIAFSTEFYYFLKNGIKSVVQQYEWLEEDLKLASSREKRAEHPWIVTFGHRPMYCSNDNGDDCSKNSTIVRQGLPIMNAFGLEDLFYKYGVDVELWAHEHCYERMWPLYNFTVYNGSLEQPYINPGAPVHIISGAAGNHEGREPFIKVIPEWSAFHSQNFGFLRMTAHNSSHLYFEQTSEDEHNKVIDKFWIIKDKHGPYTPSHT